METNISKKKIGIQIRTARKSKLYSQKDLAKKVGISSPQISRIESGTADINIDLMRKLEKELGIKLTEGEAHGNVRHYDSLSLQKGESSEPSTYYFPWINDHKYITIEVEGDAMQKSLPAGSIVGCLEEPSKGINDGDIYYIVMGDGRQLIRRLKYVPGTSGRRVSLISENDIIGSFEVDYHDIKAYHRINKVIKIFNR